MSEKNRIKLNSKQSNILWIILAILIVAYVAYSMLTSDLEHIEDQNGPEDYTLAVITDENIIKQDMGALNISMSTGLLNDGVTFKSDRFTGVYRVVLTNFLFDSDFLMDVTGFYVNSGNFRMCIVNDGKIIADVEPGMFATCELSDLNGSFELIIAGESADFEFSLDRLFCEQYGIEVGK